VTGFRLATVERLRERHAQVCVQQLHDAGQDLARAQEERNAMVAQLRSDQVPTGRLSPDQLLRASFYRERLRGDILDSAQEIGRRAQIVNERRTAWLNANAQLRAITALHDRFRAARRTALDRQEQRELDELAGTRRRVPPDTGDGLGVGEVAA
jgi:flagellar export protein FliJ